MNKKLRRNESGVALLFALGLLALMILLCVSFSMESLQSQKAASNNGHRSAAKVLGMSAVNHAAMAVLQYQNQQWDQAIANYQSGDGGYVPQNKEGEPTLGNPVDFSAVVSQSDSSVPENVKDDKLDKLLPLRSVYAGTQQFSPANPYLTWYMGVNNSDAKRKPNRIYVREGNNSDDPIVGRFAYRVLPPASSTQINLAYFLRGKQNLSTTQQKTNTGLLSELSQLDLAGSAFETMRTHAGNTTNPVVGSLQLVSGSNKALFYDADGKIASKKYDAIQRIFSDGVLPGDIEAFKLEKDSKVWYLHRYNLDQSVAVGGATADVDKVAALTRNKMKLTPFFFSDLQKDTSSTSGYDKRYLAAQNENMTPFFFGMISDTAGSFASVDSRRAQIAANFLDYCDTDDVPTSDRTDWSESAPTYTGNEKTLYINELACGIKVAAAKNGKAVDLSFTPSLFAELIDIYGGLSASNYTLTGGISSISFNVSGEVTQIQKKDDSTSRTAADLKIATTAKRVEWNVENSFITINNFTGSRYFAGFSKGTLVKLAGALEFSAIPDDYEISEFKITVDNLKITFKERLHLKNGPHNADYSRLPTSEMSVANAKIELTDTALNKYWLVGNMSVKDPRQNLNVKTGNNTSGATGANWKLNDWVFAPKVMNTDGSADVGSIGGAQNELSIKIVLNQETMTPDSVSGFINPYSNPAKPRMAAGGLEAVDINNIDSDIEKVEDPAATGTERISTAYIANKPMQSFWELGMIHRGAAWETINLGKSSITPESIFNYITGSTSPAFAGSSYKDGDAYILDMVKLSPSAVSYGLFDINMLRANYPGFDYAGANTDSNLFTEIFANLKKHNDPSSYVGGTDDTQAANLAAQIVAEAKGDTNEFLARSDIAEHFTKVFNAENDNTLTDARREEIIAKVMPLLKAEPALVTVFHVDIVAQTINDIGGFKVSKLDDNGNLVESSEETKIGTLDYDKAKDVYFDDITGQVKMRATFDCNPFTGKVKLRQIRYLD